MNSILDSIKNQLNVHPEEVGFDQEIILLINQAFSTLQQLGAGPKEGFYIVDNTSVWNDYTEDNILLQWVKMYVYLKTKFIFDPPQNSSFLNSINEEINEHEWRIRKHAEDSETG